MRLIGLGLCALVNASKRQNLAQYGKRAPGTSDFQTGGEPQGCQEDGL